MNGREMTEKSSSTPESQVARLLREEKAGRLAQGAPERMLDEPTYRKYPEFRAELLRRLKELGRVPENKQ